MDLDCFIGLRIRLSLDAATILEGTLLLGEFFEEIVFRTICLIGLDTVVGVSSRSTMLNSSSRSAARN